MATLGKASVIRPGPGIWWAERLHVAGLCFFTKPSAAWNWGYRPLREKGLLSSAFRALRSARQTRAKGMLKLFHVIEISTSGLPLHTRAHHSHQAA